MRTATASAMTMLAVTLALTGCDGGDAALRPAEVPVDAQPSASPAPDDAPAEEASGAVLTAEETFLAWLEASRAPEPEQACGYLSDELIDRMLAEFEADWGYDPGGCESLTELTAQLYESFQVSADVSISVVSETAQHAELFVTYLDGGDCGSIVMKRQGAGWVMTEQSEGCDAG